MKIAFVGLGQMGKPIAINLAKGGASVVAIDRTDRAFADLAAKGIETSTDFRHAVDADVIFLCLPNVQVVTDVLFGDRGIAASLRPGQIVVDLSTCDYTKTLAIAGKLAAAEVGFLDAPISGMEARAIDGTLTVMCGGDQALFDRVRPLFDLIGKTILYMGAAGSGQLTKLINQLLFDINAAALAEILPMAAKLGLDPARIGEVVNNGTGRSYASEFFIPRMLRGHFGDGYPMQAAYKDLVSGAALSAELGIPLPVLAAATATYQTALLKGHGPKDKGAMVLVFEELLGVAFRDGQQQTNQEEGGR
ncbi:2-hydroxymethylglutarate dehydrogenase [Aliidongia dinghuensis]|uniref:2-hydroxymethylglutarate dehydrogenase n=1 Tax=Aliidongia dinghuensis TaxID=1867774 RepID=A0A8J2YPM3_9PROT|nr:NAD(P)-dependent oxidoreductase [Aliidongia dinghuensis]GGF00456.1 2-hydroxymethylglutarate dehydrogenase [Aliidongia dinghuensis]